MASAVGRGGEGGGENGEEKDGHGGGDMVVAVADADADGVVEGEEGADAVGENKGADAMDSTTL